MIIINTIIKISVFGVLVSNKKEKFKKMWISADFTTFTSPCFAQRKQRQTNLKVKLLYPKEIHN